ncbi:unnamed protein product [Schistosoma mattheei]|uniref:Uncharacterized protein n=1 Tax=Schistosoma mattheei TaxID=31246 RepID=A0A3P8IB88_9TREM|nr:unnamed protein product [Schistosoma mattheei]
MQLPDSVSCLSENTVDALLDWLRYEFKQLGVSFKKLFGNLV